MPALLVRLFVVSRPIVCLTGLLQTGNIVAMRQNSASFESSASTARAGVSRGRTSRPCDAYDAAHPGKAVAFRRRLLGSGTRGGFRTAAGIAAAAAATGWAASFGLGTAGASAATEPPAVAEYSQVLAQAVDAGRLDSQLAVSYTHLTLPTNREV